MPPTFICHTLDLPVLFCAGFAVGMIIRKDFSLILRKVWWSVVSRHASRCRCKTIQSMNCLPCELAPDRNVHWLRSRNTPEHRRKNWSNWYSIRTSKLLTRPVCSVSVSLVSCSLSIVDARSDPDWPSMRRRKLLWRELQQKILRIPKCPTFLSE